METLAIYTRAEDGTIAYRGYEEWESEGQCLAWHFRADEKPEKETLFGWPHKRVTWYRGIGFGGSDA